MTDAAFRDHLRHTFQQFAHDERVLDLLVTALERAARRDPVLRDEIIDRPQDQIADRDTIGSFRQALGQLRHVADWLASAVEEEDAWLERVDDRGRPLKLMKIGSLARAVAEADKAMRRKLSRSGPSRTPGDGEEPHIDLGEGWSLVRLTTPASLDAESAVMQHCIGQGAYDERVVAGTAVILSLRDPAGRPHATIELEESDGCRTILQIQGKQNHNPERRYVLRLMPWLLTTQIDEDVRGELGLVMDAGGNLLEDSRLPDDVVLKGDVLLELTEGGARLPARSLIVEDGSLSIVAPPGETLVLPSVLHVPLSVLSLAGNFVFPAGMDLRAGSIRLEEGVFTGLPDDLDIPGSLRLDRAMLGRLPSGLKVQDFQSMSSDIEELPGDMIVGSRIRFGKDRLKRLPAGLRLKELVLERSALTALPDDLVVENLTIEGGAVSSIGASTVVGGNLKIRDARFLHELPSDILVHENLWIQDAGPLILPDGPAPRCVDLVDLKDFRLPEVLSVEGALSIRNTSLASMPRSLSVGGMLHLVGPPRFFDVPAGSRLGGLSVTGRPQEGGSGSGSFHVGAGTVVRHSVSITGMQRVRFGRGVRIGEGLELNGVRRSMLHRHMQIDGELDIRNCSGVRLSGSLRLRDLHLRGGTSIALPEGLVLGGVLRITGVGTVVNLPSGPLRIGSHFIWDSPAPCIVPAGSVIGGKAEINSRVGPLTETAAKDFLRSIRGRITRPGGPKTFPHQIVIGPVGLTVVEEADLNARFVRIGEGCTFGSDVDIGSLNTLMGDGVLVTGRIDHGRTDPPLPSFGSEQRVCEILESRAASYGSDAGDVSCPMR